MTIKKQNTTQQYYFYLCISALWIMVLYSAVFQFVIIQIPKGMMLFGSTVLFTYILTKINSPFVLRDELPIETIYLAVYMVYMLTVGSLFALNRSEHITQWITCLEYAIILAVIASIIKKSGIETFYYLLLFQAIILTIVFLYHPVDFDGNGRFSISSELNPNGLGMSFATGIWALLYLYQQRKISLIITSMITGIFAYCILLTGSRKSLIAMGLTIILWFLFCFIPGIKKQGGYKGIITFVLMIILTVILMRFFVAQYTGSLMAYRMDILLNETAEGNRIKMYRDGYEMLKQNLPFGFGFHGFKYQFGTYSHATLIETPISGGIIGALLYFYMYFFSIRRSFRIYTKLKGQEKHAYEQVRIKMILILWVVMIFYATCIIHQYQFDSFVLFGIIFGETAYIENKILSTSLIADPMKKGSRYIRYE